MIIDSTSLRAGNAHHDDGWLSNPTRSCQSINVGIIPFLSNVGHGARLGVLLTRLLACYDRIRSWYLTST